MMLTELTLYYEGKVVYLGFRTRRIVYLELSFPDGGNSKLVVDFGSSRYAIAKENFYPKHQDKGVAKFEGKEIRLSITELYKHITEIMKTGEKHSFLLTEES